MRRLFAGGCACGRIRFEIEAEPLAQIDCQCRDCQRESGTGHASILALRRADASIAGAATEWSAIGDSGAVKTRAFCPVCGAPVYTTFPARPDLVVLRAASLDDPSLYRPQAVLWTSSAQPWDLVDQTLPAFSRNAPS